MYTGVFSVLRDRIISDYCHNTHEDGRACLLYTSQTEFFISDNEIKVFTDRFEHILVHFDIDVLDEHFFHSTYFANPELVGDGAGGGKMTIEKLSEILQYICLLYTS